MESYPPEEEVAKASVMNRTWHFRSSSLINMDANLFLLKRAEPDSDREDQQCLESLELAAASLLQQGRSEKALGYMEQALQLRRHYYGDASAEAIAYCKSLARKMVVAAVQMMERREMTASLQILERVERLVSQFPTGKLVTESCEIYNNLACACRKHGKLSQAKQHILKALKLASVYRDAHIDRAATHLNMCAILSNQGQHSSALEYGLKAVQFAQEDLVNINLSHKGDPSHKITVLAVAYHNAGVEEEHLGRFERALNWYEKALQFVQQHGDDQHRSVLKEFEKTYQSALKSLAKKMRNSQTTVQKLTKKRPRSAYKPEMRNKIRSPLETDEESQSSTGGSRRIAQTSSQNQIQKLRLVPKKPSNSPFRHLADFNTRDPLEGKPSTFEEIRKHRFRPASPLAYPQQTASAEPSIDSGPTSLYPRPHFPRKMTKAGESDEDLRELEAMGILDFSLETTRREQTKTLARNPVKRLRGTRRKATSRGRNSEGGEAEKEHLPKVGETPERTKWEETAVRRSGTQKITQRSLAGEDLGNSQPSGRFTSIPLPQGRWEDAKEDSPEPSPKVEDLQTKADKARAEEAKRLKAREQSAAIRIQSGFRRFLAVRRAKIVARWKARRENRQLVCRVGKQFSDGTTRVVSVYRAAAGEISAVVDSHPLPLLEIPLPAESGVELDEIISKIDILPSGRLAFRVDTEEILRIQTWIRCVFARKWVEGMREARERLVVYSCQREVHGRPCAIRLIREETGKLIVDISPGAVRIPVPESLSSLSFEAISARFDLDGCTFLLQPMDNSSPPSELRQSESFSAAGRGSPLSKSSDYSVDSSHDEEKVTLIQSVFRMRRERNRYRQLQKREQKHREKLISRELVILGESYLITISRVTVGRTEIEVEAYPLTQVSVRPRKSVYEEKRVKDAFGWPASDEISTHEEELLADVRLEGNYAILQQLSPASQNKRQHYTTYKSFPDGKLYEIAFDIANEVGEIAVRLDADSSPVVASLSLPERQLKSRGNVTGGWAPRHFEALATLLTLDKGVLALNAAEKRNSVASPVITVSETHTENELTTMAYCRESQKPPADRQRAKSAVLIQSHIRRFLAQRSSRPSCPGSEVFRCFRLFPPSVPFSVQFYETPTGVTIKAVNLDSLAEHSVSLVEGTDYSPETGLNYMEVSRNIWTKRKGLGVFLLGRMNEGHNAAAVTIQKVAKGRLTRKLYQKYKEEAGRTLEICRFAVFSAEKFGLALYSYPSQIQIEVFPLRKPSQCKRKSHFSFFSLRELTNLYSAELDIERVIADVGYEHEQVALHARVLSLEARQQQYADKGVGVRTLIRTSRKLDDKMWVVTMSLTGKPMEDDIIEFTAFCGGQGKPLRLKTTAEELSRLTRLPASDIYPIGTMAIHRLLRIRGGVLILDSSEPVPRLDDLATLIQSHIRGFITRRKLVSIRPSKSQLVTCATMDLGTAQWVVYAYREPPFLKLEAVHRLNKTVLSTLVSEQVFSRFPPTLGKKRIIEKFIFPKLRLVTESGARHLRVTKSMQLQQTLLEKFQGKIQIIKHQVSRPEAGPLTATALQPMLEDIPARCDREQPADSHANSKSLGTQVASEVRLPPVQSEEASSGSSREKGDQKKESSPASDRPLTSEGVIPTPRSVLHTDRELLLRSGLELESHYFIASIYGDEQAMYVELNNPETHEKAGREIDLTGVDTGDLDQYCGDLLTRLKVRTGRSGRIELEIAEEDNSARNVLYKKSHYVSNRYCVVTFFEIRAGIVISAHDPEKRKTLELKLGHRSPQPPEQLQREIAALAKRLRIQEVLGEETLILSCS